MSVETQTSPEEVKPNGVPLIKMEKIGRRFGTITALENVDFEVGYQEIVGLLGDNGAGKSTLIKVLTGVHPPTSGRIYFEGQPVTMTAPQDARDLGIETVYQDLALVPLMNISRNFYLGREPRTYVGPLEILDKDTMDANTTQALAHIGIKIRGATEAVGTLSGGERQSIAIGRAVHFGTKLLILDEPTSALSIGETRKVIGYTTEAKKRGISVIFITHNIHHVFEVADRFTIITHGHKVGDFRKEDVTQDDVAAMIMGEPIPAQLVNRTLPHINTRPIEVRSTPPVAAISADGTQLAVQQPMTVQQRDRSRRNRTITFFAIVLLIYALVGGAILFYALAPKEQIAGLVEDVNGPGFVFKVPQNWRVRRAESQIREVDYDADQYTFVITWQSMGGWNKDTAHSKKISPSTSLDKIAQIVIDDDLSPRQYQPGTNVTVGGQPAYRFEWVNPAPNVNHSGVDFVFIDTTQNVYVVTIEGPTDKWATNLKSLADEMMAAFAFN